jgi:hypothetical protein
MSLATCLSVFFFTILYQWLVCPIIFPQRAGMILKISGGWFVPQSLATKFPSIEEAKI